jgi:hypothetical protein
MESLEPLIRQSIFRAAPAKAAEMARRLDERGVYLSFTNDAGLHFRAYHDPEIEIGWCGLEALWCAAYAYLALYQTRRTAQIEEGDRFHIGSTELSNGRELFGWSINHLATITTSDWPVALPVPAWPPANGFEGLVLEIFLVAAAWMILHECGHQLLQRPARDGLSSYDIEWEADRYATEWLFDGVNSDQAATKIAMGICVAVGLLEANRGDFLSTTHPNPFNRLKAALAYRDFPEDDLAYAFALSVLNMNWYQREYQTWIQAQDRPFRELFEQFGDAVSGKASRTWLLVRPEDAVRADRALSAPLDPALTRDLAYMLWDGRERPLGCPDKDWFAAEELQRQLRLEAVIDWVQRGAPVTESA